MASKSSLEEGMISVHEFSWHYFTLTGNIDAYLLYKHNEQLQEMGRDDADAAESDADEFG